MQKKEVGRRGSPGAKMDGSYRMMMRMDAITLRQEQRKACFAQLSSAQATERGATSYCLAVMCFSVEAMMCRFSGARGHDIPRLFDDRIEAITRTRKQRSDP